MKPILLLSGEPETVRLMLEEVTSGSVALRESEARAGCVCDRWAVVLQGFSVYSHRPKPVPFCNESNSEVTEYLRRIDCLR